MVVILLIVVLALRRQAVLLSSGVVRGSPASSRAVARVQRHWGYGGCVSRGLQGGLEGVATVVVTVVATHLQGGWKALEGGVEG
jgi:hypothetical protein